MDEPNWVVLGALQDPSQNSAISAYHLSGSSLFACDVGGDFGPIAGVMRSGPHDAIDPQRT